MAFDLNPLALANAPVLRLIATATTHEITTTNGLAAAADRDPSNVRKTLKTLEEAGLINPDPLMNGLTEDGLAQLAALDRAADPDGGGERAALLERLDPHPLNPRKDFESGEAEDGLSELRESILLRGLMQPIVVRPQPEAGKWWIVDGERRFRAIKQANWDGDWDDDKPVPIVIREVDDREHLLLSLTANLQRANMSAIEEADAFNAAVHDFGISTEDLADELGKSRRYVQQRIALLKLSPGDQDRMRLPKDDPDRLTFKAARTLTQTPREPDATARPLPHEEFSQMVAAQPHLTPSAASEPGSQPASEPAPAPSFGSTLSDREALLLVEIADKSERDPDPDFGSEGYTRVQNVPVTGAAAGLVGKNAIGFRQRGPVVMVTPRLHSTGAGAWLTEIGFHQHRDDVLFELRARVIGTYAAADLNAASPVAGSAGPYATPWLNPPDPAAVARAAQSPPSTDDDADPHQPDLIEPSEEEQAERLARAAARAQQALDDEAVDRFAAMLKDKLGEARNKGWGGWNLPEDREGGCSVDSLADKLVRQMAKGDPLDIANFAMFVAIRAGVMGGGHAIRQAVERHEQAARTTPAPAFTTALQAAENDMRRHKAQPGDVAITAALYPGLHAAFEIISHDGGASAGHLQYVVPDEWTRGIDDVDDVLASLDADTLQTLCIGEGDDIRDLVEQRPELTQSDVLLTGFTADWPARGNA